ncbi:MAG: MOSC domain-containing protein [Luteolibacter sp.]
MPLVVLHHLFRSPGHNYFGHHGMPAGENGIEDCEAIKLVAGRGILGDRFFDFKADYKGQITFFDQAVVEQVRAHTGKADLPASAFRRNVVIEGADLNSLIGHRFRLGGILFEGTQECSPCYWMDGACGMPGVEQLMKGRGGLRCRILEDGILKKAANTSLEIVSE